MKLLLESKKNHHLHFQQVNQQVSSQQVSKSTEPQESHTYLQIIKHISHVAAVVQGISIGAFSFRNLALALENISKVTPCCQEEKTVFTKSYNPITHDRVCKYQEVSRGDKPHKGTIFMEQEVRLVIFFPQPSGSLHLTVRLIFHRGDLHAL